MYIICMCVIISIVINRRTYGVYFSKTYSFGDIRKF